MKKVSAAHYFIIREIQIIRLFHKFRWLGLEVRELGVNESSQLRYQE